MLINRYLAIIETTRPDDLLASPVVIHAEVLFDLRGKKGFCNDKKIPKIKKGAKEFVEKLAKLNKYSLHIYYPLQLEQKNIKKWLAHYGLLGCFQYYVIDIPVCCMEINKNILKKQSFDEIIEFLDKNNLSLNYKYKVIQLKNYPIPEDWRDYVEE